MSSEKHYEDWIIHKSKNKAVQKTEKQTYWSLILTRTKSKRKKPECELGASCPYRHQYQHQLEFSHGETETVEESG